MRTNSGRTLRRIQVNTRTETHTLEAHLTPLPDFLLALHVGLIGDACFQSAGSHEFKNTLSLRGVGCCFVAVR